MGLQTASQVSKIFGVSTQMLRYYERSGLIESHRKDDYAYRVYDEENLQRLQQIILLRKLQIPIKQIYTILNIPMRQRRSKFSNQTFRNCKMKLLRWKR